MGHPSERTRGESGKSAQELSDSRSDEQTRCDGPHGETARKVAAAHCGSRTSLGDLFENCRNYLLLVANASMGEKLRARVAASDLVQETFLEAGAIFERFCGDSEEELLRWLTRILENKLGNAVKRHLRSAKRAASREVRLSDVGPAEILEGFMADKVPSPSGVAAAHEVDERIHAAVRQLPDDYRRVIDLRVGQALSYADVGQAMDRSPEAVRKLFVRALDDLRLRMTADDQPADHN
jgi:RNA polymerase sigma-70 factor, ECF subfamily